MKENEIRNLRFTPVTNTAEENSSESTTLESTAQCSPGRAQQASVAIISCIQTKLACLSRDEKGQGTTEYAILVGVLVVIAILAITVFRGKIQELWNNISDGINSL